MSIWRLDLNHFAKDIVAVVSSTYVVQENQRLSFTTRHFTKILVNHDTI